MTIGPSTTNAELSDALDQIIRRDFIKDALTDEEYNTLIEAEQRIRELPDEERSKASKLTTGEL